MTVRIAPPLRAGGTMRVLMTAELPVGEISENRHGRLEMHLLHIADQLSAADQLALRAYVMPEIDRRNAINAVTRRLTK